MECLQTWRLAGLQFNSCFLQNNSCIFAKERLLHYKGMLSRIPLGRLGEPDDLVGILMFLVSPASDFCTGQIIYVDGGYTAG